MGESAESSGTRWDGMEAILTRKEVFVRYRNHDVVDGRWTSPSSDVVPTEWYRLQYTDWPIDRPDVFTDSSGILARRLPYLARGLPPGRPDDPGEPVPIIPTRLLETYEIGKDDYGYGLPRDTESQYEPAELLYIDLQQPFDSHFTGVEPGIYSLFKVIRQSDMRTVAMMVDWPLGARSDSAFMTFSEYDEPGLADIEIPSVYLEFDRELYSEIP